MCDMPRLIQKSSIRLIRGCARRPIIFHDASCRRRLVDWLNLGTGEYIQDCMARIAPGVRSDDVRSPLVRQSNCPVPTIRGDHTLDIQFLHSNPLRKPSIAQTTIVLRKITLKLPSQLNCDWSVDQHRVSPSLTCNHGSYYACPVQGSHVSRRRFALRRGCASKSERAISTESRTLAFGDSSIGTSLTTSWQRTHDCGYESNGCLISIDVNGNITFGH